MLLGRSYYQNIQTPRSELKSNMQIGVGKRTKRGMLSKANLHFETPSHLGPALLLRDVAFLGTREHSGLLGQFKVLLLELIILAIELSDQGAQIIVVIPSVAGNFVDVLFQVLGYLFGACTIRGGGFFSATKQRSL